MQRKMRKGGRERNEERYALLAKLCATHTQAEISVEMGVSRQRINQMMRLAGIPTRRKRAVTLGQMKCDWCGIEIKRRTKRQMFCSRECSNTSKCTEWSLDSAHRRKKRAEWHKEYYHNVLKKLPDFHERIREYNKRAYVKKRMQKVYQKLGR
jgi:hypothetical protein